MSIRPQLQMTTRTRDQFVGMVNASARKFARAELEEMGRQWIAAVEAIIESELPRRDGERHKENTTHLENSFTYRIVETGSSGFPMVLILTIKPGVSAAKIAALEFGVDHEYEIAAINAPFLRWGDAPPDLTRPFQKSVTWSPFGPNGKGVLPNGYHFMERARDAVLAAHTRRV